MPVALQIILSVILSAPFNLVTAWDAVTSARLAARLKAIRDAGDPVTMAELAATYPDPPPGKNAADLLNAAFQKMEAREGQDEARMDRLPIVGAAQLPPLGEGVPPAMLKAIEAYLKDNAEILALLHEAAALGECKFDLDFTKGPGMLLPHLSKMRQGARLLALEAIVRAEGGKADAAADSLIAGLRMGEAVRREPLLISALVRIACDGIAAEQAARWASRAQPPPKTLERVEAAFATAADPRIIEHAMVGERCFGIDIYQNYVLRPGGGQMLEMMGGDAPADAMVLRLLPQAYFKSDMLWYLDIMNEYVAAARKPHPEAAIAGARLGRDLEQRIPRYFPVSRMILPALGRVFAAGQQHVARCEGARVALAALRYKAQHQRLPDTLDALVPDFLKAVPADPFDAKPMRYVKDAVGFAVYAVGDNGKDDGGAVEAAAGKPTDVGIRIRWPRAQF